MCISRQPSGPYSPSNQVFASFSSLDLARGFLVDLFVPEAGFALPGSTYPKTLLTSGVLYSRKKEPHALVRGRNRFVQRSPALVLPFSPCSVLFSLGDSLSSLIESIVGIRRAPEPPVLALDDFRSATTTR